jgi:GT2 family glycosyltransferase
MERVSVLTLVRNRTSHLRNVLRGLAMNANRPAEVVIIVMGGEDPRPHLEPGPLVVEYVFLKEQERLPLAAARNRAAHQSQNEFLIFLDVDCLPGPQLVSAYTHALAEHQALCVGEVRYLPRRARTDLLDFDSLKNAANAHHARRAPPTKDPWTRIRTYELFWSLSFAVRKSVLEKLGGFDEGYVGYGGEDTDLAFTARKLGVPLIWVRDALALHQYHEKSDPPLDHFDDIIANARRFHSKWNAWPMDGWLRAFAAMDLITWTPNCEAIDVMRPPTNQEVEEARVTS